MYETKLKCINCGRKYELVRMFEGCPHCGEENLSSNLIVDYDYEMIKEKIKEICPEKTIARHVAAPKASYKAYRAIKDSNGKAVTVTDDEIMNALLSFAKKEGIYSSTTSAVALGALQKLKDKGYIDKESTVVCIMTTGDIMKTYYNTVIKI